MLMLIGWSMGSDVMRLLFGADTVDADWLIGGERYHMRMLIGAEWCHGDVDGSIGGERCHVGTDWCRMVSCGGQLSRD